MILYNVVTYCSCYAFIYYRYICINRVLSKFLTLSNPSYFLHIKLQIGKKFPHYTTMCPSAFHTILLAKVGAL